jgi:hypothetical protein
MIRSSRFAHVRLLRLPQGVPHLMVQQAPAYGVPVQRRGPIVLQHFCGLHVQQSRPYHRTKHIEIDIHFVRERVAIGELRVLHVPSG